MKAIKYRCAQMKRNYSLQKKESQSVDTTYKNVKKKVFKQHNNSIHSDFLFSN